MNTYSLLPTQGWSQFLMGRREMLDEFDRAITFSKGHKVRTSHGNVAEAAFRKWLSEFLPAKYAVTSGYIVSQGFSDEIKMPHYDVIVYDALNSPILWIEDNSDNSSQGKSRAIPAEFVRLVIEVKSSCEKRTVSDAISHLEELAPLYSATDDVNERYKRFLPYNFFCGIVFFELRKKNEFDYDIFSEMKKALTIRGYFSSLILRGEGNKPLATGRIDLYSEDMPIPDIYDRGSILSNLCLNERFIVSWSEDVFSRYAFDLLAILNNNFRSGYLSSVYAFGGSMKSASRE